jgi:SAM-dependent methyltransferase
VQAHFSKHAEAFDSIYSGRKPWPLRITDRLMRQDMYRRMVLTIESQGQWHGKTVLDVGCGPGRYAMALAERGAQVTGIDFAEPMLTLARKNAQTLRHGAALTFVEGDFLTWPFGQPFDVTLANGLFDYTREPAPILRRARELTREHLIATFPRLWTYRAVVRKIRLAFFACPVHFYRRSQVTDLLESNGFAIERLVPLANSYWVLARPA